MSDEWFRDFFSGAAVDFWMAAAPPPTEDLELLERVYGPPAKRELLDLACGAGRHSIPLAQRGYRVTGIDLSSDFLSRARQAADVAGAAVDWQQRDMRDLPWESRFDGALCFGNSFFYMDRASTRELVAAIARALKPGAAFVLETGAMAESLLPSLQERRWMDVGDVLFLSSERYEPSESRLDIEYSFVRGGIRETKSAHTWIYTVAEFRELAMQCGFAVESLLASPRGEAFRLGSPRLILVARKQ